ncbi:hypothetical protein GQR36_17690 [Enterococcus termitis]
MTEKKYCCITFYGLLGKEEEKIRMKVLLVGLGWFGKKHYNVWNDLGVEIVGVFEKEGFSISQNDEQSKYHKEVVEYTDSSQITFLMSCSK